MRRYDCRSRRGVRERPDFRPSKTRVPPSGPRARRGVLLLVVLSLLAMFGLIAVAFVVITGHQMRGALAIQRIGQHTTRPREDLHRGAMQVFRGSDNPGSVMRSIGLLEDLYGQVHVNGLDDDEDGAIDEPDERLRFEYIIPAAPVPVAGGQLIEFPIANANRWLGCVLTMRTGPAAGQSTRIVGINPTSGAAQMLAFWGPPPNQGDIYLINGTPFAGTGYGFNPTSGKLDAVSGVWPLALLPGDPLNRNPAGGANEDYDAVDFQNMLLAMVLPDLTDSAGNASIVPIPSLHRPALVKYWMTQASDWATNFDLQRRVILRPLPPDHPDFDGSNPSFNPAWDGITSGGGSWDVDNDGDGIPDGIWVDLGMPVRSTADGRLYKPLYSILCVDLDGRLNLNAHGCLAQADPTDSTGPSGGGPNQVPDYYDPGVLPGGRQFAGGSSSASLPRGQGYGPGEINLAVLFAPSTPPTVQAISRYQQLLVGNGNFQGRYGEAGVAAPAPGFSGIDDPLSHNLGTRFWDASTYYPNGWTYWGFLTSPGNYRPDAYGAPVDFNGNGFVGLDFGGRPLYWWMAEGNEQQDDPYEIDLSQNAGHGLTSRAPIDNPFSLSEWERLVRPFDRDTSRLPVRLWALTYDNSVGKSALHDRRHAITPESWDLPCPNIALPKHLRDELRNRGVQRPTHVTDLLRAKGVPQARWKELLPTEVLAGLKMDLNRPFGDAHDNEPMNGVVDEPGEANEQLTLYRSPGQPVPVPFSYGEDGALPNSLAARQLYARHLYVLFRLLADTDYLQKQLGTEEEVWRFLAQWAINVVDFCDRDSIMTPFEFDPDPFGSSGWRPDGNPATNEGIAEPHVVWGCERPELLITETLAFHDRRTEDTADEEFDGQGPEKEAGTTTDTDPDKKDKDFDQKQRPQGSLFVEVYSPWTSMEPPPGEFCYDRTNATWSGGVRLNQTASNGDPVWRLIVVDPEEDRDHPGEHADPDDPIATNRPAKIERSVYFIDPSASGFDDPKDGQAYYPAATVPMAAVLPGRYAVVGPGEPTESGPEYPTYIGERSDGGRPNQTRRIVLKPNANPNPRQVYVRQNKNGAAPDLPDNQIMPPVAAVINQPRRLSISEPTGGYPEVDAAGQPYDVGSGEYTKPYDKPLDAQNADPTMAAALQRTGTTTGVRIVHLQRLANPLLPWNPEVNPNPKLPVNPYLTIDSSPVDLTAFNGITSDQDPSDAVGDVMFHTRERGELEQQNATSPGINNLWKQEPTPKTVVNDAGGRVPSHYFSHPFEHTLGYLNEPFGPPTPNPSYRGDPQQPFPWLTWNNRPFVSQLELLLVPALRSSKLLVRNNDQTKDPYFRFVKPGDVPEPYTPSTSQKVPYPHLLNFFHSTKSDPSGGSPQLHRLLEYVHVPSRFVGTELQGNPTAFAAPGGHSFHPPFNRISRCREPGRINLNTIFDERVFRGLMNYFPFQGINDGTFFAKFVESRRGYGSGGDLLALNTSFPTRFARPFRSFAGGQMVPLANMEPPREIDATLLRSDGDANPRPLFRYDHAAVPPAAYPDDTNRNPYFRYQGLQRLGNLVTTRSNVYAIWITVGYFEVEPITSANFQSLKPEVATWPQAQVQAVYPDGYALGQELGIETGEVERHRAFYVFDRSIPVGFRRGQDLNVEKAILLKRFIE